MLEIKLSLTNLQNKKQDPSIHKIGNKVLNPKQIDIKSDPSIKVKNESK